MNTDEKMNLLGLSESDMSGFKECFRAVSLECLEHLSELQEAGSCLTYSMFCEGYEPERQECKGCVLLNRKGESNG